MGGIVKPSSVQRSEKRMQASRKLDILRRRSSDLADAKPVLRNLAAAGHVKPQYVPLFKGVCRSLRQKGSDTESSGSDMSDGDDEEVKGEALHSLSALVNEYLSDTAASPDQGGDSIDSEGQQDLEPSGLRNGRGSGMQTSDAGVAGRSVADDKELRKLLKELAHPMSPMEMKVTRDVADVLKAVHDDANNRQLLCQVEADSEDTARVLRKVASRLSALGYNAGVCKSQWDHSRGFPGGVYEYIDVMGSTEYPLKKPTDRIMLDLSFRAQFEIARPSAEYRSLLQALPAVFVGPSASLETAVALMASAMKRSMAKNGMQLPPWRKIEYIRAKWLSPYERITNFLDSHGPSPPTPSTSGRSTEVSEEEWAAWSPVVFNNDDLANQSATPAADLAQDMQEEDRPATANREDGGLEGRVVRGNLYARIHPEVVWESRDWSNTPKADAVRFRINQQWQLPSRQRSSQAQGRAKGMSALAVALERALTIRI